MNLPLMVFVLLMNVISEELWWRGYILPRQEKQHGRYTWAIHGVLWAFFHAFKWWAVPFMLFTLAMVPMHLDPYLGFLHSYFRFKSSLVYDLIEPFRVVAGEFVLSYHELLSQSCFERVGKRIYLKKDEEVQFMEAMNKILKKRVAYLRYENPEKSANHNHHQRRTNKTSTIHQKQTPKKPTTHFSVNSARAFYFE